VETASHQGHVAPATLSETGGRRSWRRIGRPWKAEKYKKKIDISENIAMMSGSSGPKPRSNLPRPLRTVRRCEELPKRRFTIGCSWALGVGRGRARRWRNEKPVKLLKTNDLAKRRDFAGNDSNDLRPAMRNLSFRHAKDSVRFRRLWASSRPEAQSPLPFQSLRLRLQIVARLKRWTAKSCAQEMLRPWNPWRA
jgi:hypothetical protein